MIFAHSRRKLVLLSLLVFFTDLCFLLDTELLEWISMVISTHVTDAEGDWKVADYAEHPECVGCTMEIRGHGLDPNTFKLHIHVVNYLTCILHHHSGNDQWDASDVFSTRMTGPPEQLDEEHAFRQMLSHLRKLTVKDEHQLIIETTTGELVRLERLP